MKRFLILFFGPFFWATCLCHQGQNGRNCVASRLIKPHSSKGNTVWLKWLCKKCFCLLCLFQSLFRIWIWLHIHRQWITDPAPFKKLPQVLGKKSRLKKNVPLCLKPETAFNVDNHYLFAVIIRFPVKLSFNQTKAMFAFGFTHLNSVCVSMESKKTCSMHFLLKTPGKTSTVCRCLSSMWTVLPNSSRGKKPSVSHTCCNHALLSGSAVGS